MTTVHQPHRQATGNILLKLVRSDIGRLGSHLFRLANSQAQLKCWLPSRLCTEEGSTGPTSPECSPIGIGPAGAGSAARRCSTRAHLRLIAFFIGAASA